MKKDQSEAREAAARKDFIDRCGISNGDGLCTIVDGVGNRRYGYAFTGSGTDNLPQHSETAEFNPKTIWGNGTNTMAIEAKLRARKKELGYVEKERRGGARPGAGRPKKK